MQDGTDISYSTRPEWDNLEVIGRNPATAAAPGVHWHATLAINGEGLPLGGLRCAYRKKEGQTQTHPWMDGLHDLDAAAQDARTERHGPGGGGVCDIGSAAAL